MYTSVIIDDEKWVIKSLQAILNTQAYFEVVGVAYNGVTGLDLLIEKKPDLAFVDIKMPGLGGLELLQAANKENLDTVFIIISGHAEFAYVQKAMTQNAIGYCLKPFSSTEIHEAVIRAKEKIDYHLSHIKQQIEQPDTTQSSQNGVKNKTVNAMLSYIHSNYAENISIQQIANHCNLNANYASQLFHQKMHKTFSCYLTGLRLDQAVNLLRSTDMPISEVAAKTGYRDYFYFAKVFKRTLKVTPTEYRKQLEHQEVHPYV